MVMIQPFRRTNREFDPLDHGSALAEGSLDVDMGDPPCFLAPESSCLQVEMEPGLQRTIQNRNNASYFM